MPTVLVVGPYAFVFFSSDRGEPFHIHVRRERMVVKLWFDPIRIATNRGFPPHEVNEMMRIAERHEDMIREAWHDYFGT